MYKQHTIIIKIWRIDTVNIMWYYIDNIIDGNFFYSINKEAFMKKIKKLVSMLLVFAMTFSVAIQEKLQALPRLVPERLLEAMIF